MRKAGQVTLRQRVFACFMTKYGLNPTTAGVGGAGGSTNWELGKYDLAPYTYESVLKGRQWNCRLCGSEHVHSETHLCGVAESYLAEVLYLTQEQLRMCSDDTIEALMRERFRQAEQLDRELSGTVRWTTGPLGQTDRRRLFETMKWEDTL